MIARLKERLLTGAVFVPLALMVTVLAFLQYRWSNQVSESTSLRLADSVQMSMINWHEDLFRDFSQICIIFALDQRAGAPPELQRYAGRFLEWRTAASYPDLISNLYVAQRDAGGPKLRRFDASSRVWVNAPWPTTLNAIRAQLIHVPTGTAANETDVHGREHATIDSYPPGLMAGWQFEPAIPALLHSTAGNGEQGAQWIVVELNNDVIRKRVMPDLARRYFQGTNGLDFKIAVLGGAPRGVIYSSDLDFGPQTVADADGILNVFGRDWSTGLASPVHVFHDTSADTGAAAPLEVSWFPLFSNAPPDEDWRLYVQHRRGGPLGAFAREFRQRDLMLSFGILFLLVASMGMLVVSTRRAQSLAKLQMDFVTTVSHELRTPLTVINSAADNIARGVVDGKQQMVQYGALIQKQAHQLSALVEQVLLFAATRQGRLLYSFTPVEVRDIVNAALVNTLGLAESAQFAIEQEIDPGLPPVMGDAALFAQCIQNLINNALKYSGKEKWLRISAKYDREAHEIEISVADRGLGISEKDLPHIFEPFYRSSAVVTAQVHGTGLGLALARNIAEAMKGRLTVASTVAKGSTFTLRVPCVDGAAARMPRAERAV